VTLRRLSAKLRHLWRDESGGAIVEYALVLTFFTLLAVGGFQLISSNAATQYNASSNQMTNIEENPLATVAP